MGDIPCYTLAAENRRAEHRAATPLCHESVLLGYRLTGSWVMHFPFLTMFMTFS